MESIKIVKFKGGLGNQLFQYAFLRNLEIIGHCNYIRVDFLFYKDFLETNRDVFMKKEGEILPNITKLKVNLIQASDEEFNKIWILKVRKGISSKLYWKIKHFLEKTFNNKIYYQFNFKYIEINEILQFEYFLGYWQSWQYVTKIEKELKTAIVLRENYSINTYKIVSKLKKENSVFIGVRRGDYLANENNLKIFGTFKEEYYNKAIQYIKDYVENPIFYVFSDDIKWVKENMKFVVPVNYREEEDQTDDVEELFVMGACKHAIIVNSTFQWWGAWLIDNKDKIVIAPDPWFNDGTPIDIVPPEWVKIERC